MASIVSASYGMHGNIDDVTSLITSQYANGERLFLIAVHANPEINGAPVTDPCYGVLKTLSITYKVGNGLQCAMTVDNDPRGAALP